MRLIFRLIYASAICVLLISLSCVSNTFTITKGSGGGFTGTWYYYSVNQDGIVSRKIIPFYIPSQDINEEVIGKISVRDAKRLYSRLNEIDFDKIDYHHHNWTESLGLTVNSKYHEVSWYENAEEIKPVMDIYDDMSKLFAPIVDSIIEKEKNRTDKEK